MTALKRKAIQLVEQMPEEQISYVIQYIHTLKNRKLVAEPIFDSDVTSTPKMKAFMELEKMVVPISPELDYDKELSETRNEKYARLHCFS